MGFWHTGYLEFHEPTGENTPHVSKPKAPEFVCELCGVVFLTDRDLRVHRFQGHPHKRPVLAFKGRECGRSRVFVTGRTEPDDWEIGSADLAILNGEPLQLDEVIMRLAAWTTGIIDLVLLNGEVPREFQIEFALADEDDLDAVDAALSDLVSGGDLSLRSIDEFIMRCRPRKSASRYLDGLAEYLYGVRIREGLGESGDLDPASYTGRFDSSVAKLGDFDRPPAEAICGIVAFHYNQFDRAMTKTKSARVADVCLRFQQMLEGGDWSRSAIPRASSSTMDYVLSDSVIERILEWSAVPLDGSASTAVQDMTAEIGGQRPQDALKLGLIATEHFAAQGDWGSARRFADRLRDSRLTETWYAAFRARGDQ